MNGWITPEGTFHALPTPTSLHVAAVKQHFPGATNSDPAFAAGWMHVGHWNDDEGKSLAGYTHGHEATEDQLRKIKQLAKDHAFDAVHFESGGRSRVLRLSREPQMTTKHALMTAIALGRYDALDPLIDHLIEEGDPHGEALLRAETAPGGSIRLYHPVEATKEPFGPVQDIDGRGHDVEAGRLVHPEGHLGIAYDTGYLRGAPEFHDHRPLQEALPLFLKHAATSDGALHGFANYLEHTGHPAAKGFRAALTDGQVHHTTESEFEGSTDLDQQHALKWGRFSYGPHTLEYGPPHPKQSSGIHRYNADLSESSLKLARGTMTPKISEAKNNPVFNKTTFASHLSHVFKTGTSAMKDAVKRIATGRGVFRNGSDAYTELGTALKQSNDPTHLGIAAKYNWNRMNKTAELDRHVADVLRKHNVAGLDEDTLFHRAGADTNRGKVVSHLMRYLPKGPLASEAFKGVLTEDHLHKSLQRLRESARDRLHGGKKEKWDALLDATAKEHAGVVVQKALAKERSKVRTALRFSREPDLVDNLIAAKPPTKPIPDWRSPENRKKLDALLEATAGHAHSESVDHLAPLVDFLSLIHHPSDGIAIRATTLPGGWVFRTAQGSSAADPHFQDRHDAVVHPSFHAERFDGTTFPGVSATVRHSTLPISVTFRSPHTNRKEVQEIAASHPDPIRRIIARGALDSDAVDWHNERRREWPMRPRPIWTDHSYTGE